MYLVDIAPVSGAQIRIQFLLRVVRRNLCSCEVIKEIDRDPLLAYPSAKISYQMVLRQADCALRHALYHFCPPLVHEPAVLLGHSIQPSVLFSDGKINSRLFPEHGQV